MGRVTPIDPACERARCLASLRVDGETTEFEGAFLDSHLAVCADCADLAAGIAASTAAIRASTLVVPPVLTLPTARRRGPAFRHLQAAAAAIVLLGAGLAGLAGVPRPDGSSSERSSPRPAYLDSASYEQKFIRQLGAGPPPSRWPSSLKKLAS
jgi:hypothetical protein